MALNREALAWLWKASPRPSWARSSPRKSARPHPRGRICNLEIDRALPIHTAWNIGVDDACAIWVFQVEMGPVNVVDYKILSAGDFAPEGELGQHPM